MDTVLPLAVAHRRVEPEDSLQFFPTPPWATRALFVHVLGTGRRAEVVEEPACGQGHMAYVLAEYFDTVVASDIAAYGYGEVRDFLAPDPIGDRSQPDWIITNPPFGDETLKFYRRAVGRARRGVAMFVRTTQLDGKRRGRFFASNPPAIVAQFMERVPLHKERWEPDGSTQTAYCWMVWRTDRRVARTDLVWIPPCRHELHLARDVQRFGESP